jgi:hypothetical protein
MRPPGQVEMELFNAVPQMREAPLKYVLMRKAPGGPVRLVVVLRFEIPQTEENCAALFDIVYSSVSRVWVTGPLAAPEKGRA